MCQRDTRLRELETRIHELCYSGIQHPRHPHDGLLPSIKFVAPCYRPPFIEGLNRALTSLTRHARILDIVMRKTLLPRLGFARGSLTFSRGWSLTWFHRESSIFGISWSLRLRTLLLRGSRVIISFPMPIGSHS